MKNKLTNLFNKPIEILDNLIILKEQSEFATQMQTIEMFSEKWSKNETAFTLNGIQKFQLNWYLQLYGFSSEENLKSFLATKKIIFDAGSGLGYKAAWFATLAPKSMVIGMDFSTAAYEAARYYKHIPNLFFVRGDIADTQIKPGSINYINCDQVIHHTENPEKTFAHLTKRLAKNGEFACYVYAKKALPRELLDDYFRTFALQCTNKQLWNLSNQLTELGKTLSDLSIKIDVPDIPLLGIKGGNYDLQRFIYWNFIKCFWNEQFGWENSAATNFDWYGPANAARYSKSEFLQWITNNHLKTKYFHQEEACYSGRFFKV